MLKEIINAIMVFIRGERTPESVAAALDKLAAARVSERKEKLDWRNSIIDLLKLLNKPSDTLTRKQLATDFNFKGEYTGTASDNIWLHGKVMEALNRKDISLP